MHPAKPKVYLHAVIDNFSRRILAWRVTYCTTDEFGYAAQENPVSIHDFHATMLNLLGIDHTRLAVSFQGLDVRLTGVAGTVVKDILA